mmetsp:Transcript_7359/g.18036  ORF Transcript_7359/g.18036 Transcript_7359/m.18036 type:complete len:199 (+) Transcript_7359:1226-1822(+)
MAPPSKKKGGGGPSKGPSPTGIIDLTADSGSDSDMSDADQLERLGGVRKRLAGSNNNNNNNNNADANDRADADNVNEMCEVVYTDAGKCETKYGIEEGFIQTNVYANGGDRVNQVENEYRVCTWIESLMLDAYDESGEINLQGDQILIYREVTPLQKTTFSLLFLTVVSLVVAGWFTQRQIEKSSKIDLSSQTDAVIT